MINLPKAVVLAMLHGYRRWLSPMLPPVCRFQPSCSAYTVQAVERFGVVRGLFLGLFRLSKCHPFHPGGYDPVPEAKEPHCHHHPEAGEVRPAAGSIDEKD